MEPEFVTLPFTIAVDTREQLPYRFQGITADAKEKHAPLIIKTEVVTLQTGDYSIIGMEDVVTIERKSIDDAYSTLVHSRDRFIRELERMREYKFSCIVIESTEDALLRYVAENTRCSPKTIYRTINSFQVQFPTQWRFSNGRDMAMRNTLRLLQASWKHHGK